MATKTRLLFILVLLYCARSFGQNKSDSVRHESTPKHDMAPVTSPVSVPGMNCPLIINPEPLTLRSEALGTIYVSGVLSALGQVQTSVFTGDKTWQSDLTNAQVLIQKNTGLIQFFLQAGSYSVPDLGLAYIRASQATDGFYGVLPQGFLKIAPTKNFSIMAGKLPTLMGAEYTFSFENTNIQRGLLWNQENAVNRGVQVNYATGPLTVALSVNDGFYSNTYNWISGSLTYAISGTNSVSFVGSGSTSRTTSNTLATPIYQNNEQLYNLIFTHASSALTIQPYLQYTFVPQSAVLNTTQDASTYGAALFVNYSFPNTGFSLPTRLEYIKSTGTTDKGAPSLIYGPGSNAWSVTLTPTYQYKRFFARAEASYVQAGNITPGSAMGPVGNDANQTRGLVELGLLF